MKITISFNYYIFFITINSKLLEYTNRIYSIKITNT